MVTDSDIIGRNGKIKLAVLLRVMSQTQGICARSFILFFMGSLAVFCIQGGSFVFDSHWFIKDDESRNDNAFQNRWRGTFNFI